MPKPEAKKSVKKIIKKRAKSPVVSGNIYIQSTFNNTLITITDEKGGAIAQSSAGALGFKGAKKSTPYAAQLAVAAVVEKAKARGFSKANIYVSGVGSGRDAAVRALANTNIEAGLIKDVTPIPHNGCRAKKPRRV
ncbi:30S ribosomal protein S11 [Candidatus Berkelbacteria bacterium CG10_big_fil_rev_8_21_14_0_10_43_13]|uniref:Small ribosomal subunit protein uS11 n=1 Tax=Candidatus Berkelbacteria bacterium CG10_big_fil_rev_8_21_14_0_10_43_13 TaxID=1974514 RepID=A0A2H0W6C6_9BACT|nr:MAG: 30S ribosomal protein S11 [Candidatus Berkelbacteria bacterium CG10_big_fil_rev_8_21_14_0_10_43_13]